MKTQNNTILPADTCALAVKTNNVGFVSTRLAGTDGVSLEAEKWAKVFEKQGFTCFYFAGELDTPPDRSYLVEEAHFQHPDIKDIHENSFGVSLRGRFITRKIYTIKRKIKDHLYKFIEKFNIGLLVIENAVTIPLNIPLGIAITELISEVGMPAIAHHHDFYWERQAFLKNAVREYLSLAFPPNLPTIQHVVINSEGDNQLGLRTGISSTFIPNVMDFENPPLPPDEYTYDIRHSLGIEDDELLVLQPTRVVKRKGIEHAIELVNRLGLKAKLVISHASGDEGYAYEQRVKEYSKLLNVNTLFVSRIINEERGYTKDGKKIYTLEDIYPYADLVTYPSDYEGFGNAFLEAVYFRKPIVVNTYSIYTADIKPKGFKTIELEGFVSKEAVAKTKKILKNPQLKEQMVNHNYKIAKCYYSYSGLEQNIKGLICKCIPCLP
ncbi:MAG: glycosyltransferase family 4 protein [Deltaproteobacteria bacterium]|nr:glycosyltransferase family 4 protein [Deltaproteobacteria bacterium]MBW2099192.1 glycosyltransferase family 4 protein [Deltaproteobacteria bacterium]